MFNQLVAREVRKTCPRFQVAEDIYWGDLGVGFLWNLRSVPDIRKTETQGPEEDALKNADLLRIVSDEASDGKVEHLGPPQTIGRSGQARSGWFGESDVRRRSRPVRSPLDPAAGQVSLGR